MSNPNLPQPSAERLAYLVNKHLVPALQKQPKEEKLKEEKGT